MSSLFSTYINGLGSSLSTLINLEDPLDWWMLAIPLLLPFYYGFIATL